MANPRKKSAEPAPEPILPRIGDKVTIPSKSAGRPQVVVCLEVEYVASDGTEVTLRLPGTNLQWFRVPADRLMR